MSSGANGLSVEMPLQEARRALPLFEKIGKCKRQILLVQVELAAEGAENFLLRFRAGERGGDVAQSFDAPFTDADGLSLR